MLDIILDGLGCFNNHDDTVSNAVLHPMDMKSSSMAGVARP